MSASTGPFARVLVVDDDPFVRDFLCRILLDMGIAVQTAADGAEAEKWLRAASFDLLFLDLDLPQVPGELLLEMMKKRLLLRPESVVVMSAQGNLSQLSLAGWADAGVANLLPKPFTAGDVRALARRALEAEGVATAPPAIRVLVAGSGLWLEGLSRVLEKSGSGTAFARRPEEILTMARQTRPAVIVLGSAVLQDELPRVLATLKEDPGLGPAALVVALETDSRLRLDDLYQAGATRVLWVPGELADLSTTVTRLAGLSRRLHPRAPLVSPVRLTSPQSSLVGTAVDVSESGLGVKGLSSRPYLETMQVEFSLPAEPDPLTGQAEIVWTRPGNDETHRVGLHFLSLEEGLKQRVREYVATHG